MNTHTHTRPKIINNADMCKLLCCAIENLGQGTGRKLGKEKVLIETIYVQHRSTQVSDNDYYLINHHLTNMRR
jgi:hypothetical protein